VVQGHACGEGGREHGRCRDADVCGLRTVRHTSPEVESMCVHVWVGLLEGHVSPYAWGTKIWDPHARYKAYQHAGRLIKRTITHMREGLSAWYATIDPPVCVEVRGRDEASLLIASPVFMFWMIG
jgi:hypothetical protein